MKEQHAISTTPEIETALEAEVFENREQVRAHHRYSQELGFLRYIKEGNVDAVCRKVEAYKASIFGIMSKDPTRQQLYIFIASVTLVTRFAVEGGMIEEDAYHLSDTYIQKADACSTAEEIQALYIKMHIDFASRVRSSKVDTPFSYEINLTIEYIFSHLHYDITLNELAEHVGFYPTYLSYLFKKETGITITSFIHKRRIEEAESLLRYSEYTLAEISQYLGFCSQSHFSAVFRKYTDMTPLQYRKNHFSRNW